MKIVVQRVNEASVTYENTTNSIKKGICVLVGIRTDDFEMDTDYIISKILNMRLWDDGDKTWCKSVMDIDGEILIVSQFTLYGFMKGHKPDFHNSMNNEDSKAMYDKFIEKLKQKWPKVQHGFFGEHMTVHIVNDGPVTIVLDSREEERLEGAEGMAKMGGIKALKGYERHLKAKEAASNKQKSKETQIVSEQNNAPQMETQQVE
ncbi:D-tyrosyl-tRNA(Tyr)_deacylase [Hexamita inflata]|uniref:D-aminoacyl-tRNA deacylase n=1 Tax=Hexamita inflata TaxID=28002 RepID=A0AA86UGZ7_9EUKA|nr:D-tyrosyl-tRNA(Tyr) deacylase [Hexamita inflata]